jgi:hypothetical protein
MPKKKVYRRKAKAKPQAGSGKGVRSTYVSDFDPPFKIRELDNGQGLICPFVDCETRFVLNLDVLKNCTGRRMNSRSVVCPSCERRSPLPKEYT